MPETRRLLCYNLNNSAGRIQGARNKAMGLQKGRSDMVFYYAGRATHIELKLPGEKQSKDQKAFQAAIEAQGFEYHIIRTLEDFQALIKSKLEGIK